jgi:hypothetical protein
LKAFGRHRNTKVNILLYPYDYFTKWSPKEVN